MSIRRVTAIVVFGGLLVLAMGTALTPSERVVLPGAQRTYRGVVHVHSSASHDAEQSLDQIAEAAREAELNFVVVTDHNKRAFTRPEYRKEVLLIPSVEVSTDNGHVLVIGGDTSLREVDGSWAAVTAARAGGAFVVGSHPDSSKHPISDTPLAELNGYEVLSSSTDFYRELRASLGASFLRYPFNRQQAMIAMYPNVSPSLERFENMSHDKRTVFTCGVDDHGRIPHAFRLETYVTYLPTMLPEMRAEEDAALVIERLREGRSFCALGLLGDASAFSLTLRSGGRMGGAGDTASVPTKLLVRWNGPAVSDQQFVIMKDGKEWRREPAQNLELVLDGVGRYRVDVERSIPSWGFLRRTVRWIYGNPFYVDGQAG